jgi:hypothetical protein
MHGDNPRHPERTLLYQTVCEHYEIWLDLASAGQFDGQGDHYTSKPYVRKAFAKYSAMATTPAGSGHHAHRLFSPLRQTTKASTSWASYKVTNGLFMTKISFSVKVKYIP